MSTTQSVRLKELLVPKSTDRVWKCEFSDKIRVNSSETSFTGRLRWRVRARRGPERLGGTPEFRDPVVAQREVEEGRARIQLFWHLGDGVALHVEVPQPCQGVECGREGPGLGLSG